MTKNSESIKKTVSTKEQNDDNTADIATVAASDNKQKKTKRTTQKTKPANKTSMTKDDEAEVLLTDNHENDAHKHVHVAHKEAFLEFVEIENNTMVLREVGTEEALVSIAFGDKVMEMFGEQNIQNIGHHMISAAIASVMDRQMKQYHAHVYDEKPKFFS